MEELLKKYGYRLSSESNEWRKDIWTVRKLYNEIEAFDSPRINTPGHYYKCNVQELDLENLLLEIDEFIK